MHMDYRVGIVLAVLLLTSFAYMYTDIKNSNDRLEEKIEGLYQQEGIELEEERTLGRNSTSRLQELQKELQRMEEDRKVSSARLEELQKQLQKLPATEPEYQALIEEGKQCLLLSTKKRWKQCWGDLRRKIWLKELDELEKLPREQLSKFFTPHFYQPFDLFPVTYDCDPNNMKRVGNEGDGGKWICEPIVTPAGCTIISIGSMGDFSFERGMKAFTGGKCKIYTFDCTGTWTSDASEFHSWCVSGKDYVENGRTYKRLSTIVTELGITGISYLKMDIEGYEWRVLPDILSETNQIALPNQISFELHVHETNLREADVVDGDWFTPTVKLARLLDNTGYRVAIQEHNTLCLYCTELIIIKSPVKELGK